MPGDANPIYLRAVQVRESPTPLDVWSAGGDMARPNPDWVKRLNRAGWPSRLVALDVPQTESDRHGRRGQATRSVSQDVIVVPASWLRRLAELLGVEWSRACHPDAAGW